MTTENLHLLGVDMGLRTGLALYSPEGRLIKYRSKHFGSKSQLRKGLHSIISELPPLGWIWLEGGGDIAEVWSQHAERQNIEYHQLQAEEWRSGLLLSRQQRSGIQAKKHADTLARKVIDWSGTRRPRGELRHDTAEAILIGLHGAIESGLLPRIPDL